MIAPAYLAGAVGTGFLADALPNRFIMIGTNGLIAAGLASYLTLSSDEQAIANGLVIGLASGSHMTVSSVVWANYYGKSHLGSIRGVAFLASLVWCIRSSVVNKWVLYANPFLRFEQEYGFLSFRKPSNNVVNYGYRTLAARPRNTVGECLGV